MGGPRRLLVVVFAVFAFAMGRECLAQTGSRPATPQEIANLIAKLDAAMFKGATFPWGRPDSPLPGCQAPGIRTFDDDTWGRRHQNRFFQGDKAKTRIDPDGSTDIVLPPEAFDPSPDGWPDGDAASTVAHEMGHTAGFGNDEGLEPGDERDAAEAEHFELYKEDLKALCLYLTWLADNPSCVYWVDLCKYCQQYADVRATANAMNHPGSANIPACLMCMLNGC